MAYQRYNQSVNQSINQIYLSRRSGPLLRTNLTPSVQHVGPAWQKNSKSASK